MREAGLACAACGDDAFVGLVELDGVRVRCRSCGSTSAAVERVYAARHAVARQLILGFHEC